MSDSPPEDVEDDGPNPLDQQRHLMELLSQETRHQVIQTILGHPAYLASEDELNYLIPDRTRKTVRDQARELVEADILAVYERPENSGKRGLPVQFFGPTEYGVDVLDDFNYLKGVPMMQALYRKTRKNEKIERHRNAPRPELPEAVLKALRIEQESEEAVEAR